VLRDPTRERVIDQAIDAYVRWREECSHARDAYARSLGRQGKEAAEALIACLAALDREQRAAAVYRDCLARYPGPLDTGDQAVWSAGPPRVRTADRR
jgi:hypothetical protein